MSRVRPARPVPIARAVRPAVAAACELLGIDPRTVSRKLERWDETDAAADEPSPS